MWAHYLQDRIHPTATLRGAFSRRYVVEPTTKTRRVNIQLAKDVDESITIANTKGVLSAFLYMVRRGIPENIIRRLVRGERVRKPASQLIH